MEKKYISDFEIGEMVETTVVVRRVSTKEYQKGKFLSLELGDKTARIDGVMWNGFETLEKEIHAGDVVQVSGKVTQYQDKRQIQVQKVLRLKENEINKLDFINKSEKDPAALVKELNQNIAAVKDPMIKGLLDKFFQDEKIQAAYQEAPAGKLWHHAYLGGLLEHSLSVLKFCHLACDLYPILSRDLLTAGALLHDIGKIVEYSVTTFIDFSDVGRLKGHLVIGAQIVEKAMDEIAGFPEQSRNKIIHLILSHQGKQEMGSPVVPQTLEAMVLHCADEMDSKTNALVRIYEKEHDQGKNWSEYIQLLGRYLYLK